MLLKKSQTFLSVRFISVCVPVSRSRHAKPHLKVASNLVLVCGFFCCCWGVFLGGEGVVWLVFF